MNHPDIPDGLDPFADDAEVPDQDARTFLAGNPRQHLALSIAASVSGAAMVAALTAMVVLDQWLHNTNPRTWLLLVATSVGLWLLTAALGAAAHAVRPVWTPERLTRQLAVPVLTEDERSELAALNADAPAPARRPSPGPAALRRRARALTETGTRQ